MKKILFILFTTLFLSTPVHAVQKGGAGHDNPEASLPFDTYDVNFTTEGDLPSPIPATMLLLAGDNDSDNDTLDLQDGDVAGQVLYIVASSGVDFNDTITISMSDTTCTNCVPINFYNVGEMSSLIWSGSSWRVLTSPGAGRLDYNTWTPGLSFAGDTTGIAYSDRNGSYIRIGTFALIIGYIQLSNKGSDNGNVRVSLPFTAYTNDVSGNVPVLITTVNLSGTGAIRASLNAGNSYFSIIDDDGNMDDADCANNTQIRFSLICKIVE